VTRLEREAAVERYRASLAAEYARTFPGSRRHFERHGAVLLDRVSHAIRWNEPFMPVARRAAGAAFEDLDGRRIVDYWQGHFANILGHNPPEVTRVLAQALEQGRGLQTGMVHEIEAELAALVCRATGAETARFTTSGSLGTFYAVLLARAFTGRDRVLKVSGGWHGSQPFGLKGVAPQGTSFDHLESEGLSSSAGAEVLLTRFNDVEALGRAFAHDGDRLACLLLEPLLGAGGGMAASGEYLRQARQLTERHGALLVCDEIITGLRFHAGTLCGLYGVRPDLLVLGKILGGGMPVSAVAGRADVLRLATRESHRVKFEGGTYSAHELSLLASSVLLDRLVTHAGEIYPALSATGDRLRAGLAAVAAECGFALAVLGVPEIPGHSGSLVLAHLLAGDGAEIRCPEDLAAARHPWIDERLLKSTLLLEGLSTRAGLGAASTAHTEQDVAFTLDAWRAGLLRLKRAGLG